MKLTDQSMIATNRAFFIARVSVSVLPRNLKTQRSMQSCANFNPWFIVCDEDCPAGNSFTQKH